MSTDLDVEVTRTERLYDGFLTLEQAYFRHTTPDGDMTGEVMRLNVERGDGAAVLLVNMDAGTVVLTRQFRYANWKRGDGGTILEIPAGTVPLDHDPAECARSEMLEEVGYRVGELRFRLVFYASPGTSTERVFLYSAEVTDRDRVSKGGGCEDEHEYIEVVEIPIAEALERLARGDIQDAKTVIALQFLASG